VDVREQILAQTIRHFAAQGFDGTSLKEIAEAVGIRKASLLYHFPSKDILHRRALETVVSHWQEVLPNLLRAATSGEEQFEAVIQETIDFFISDPDRARLMVREVLDRPEAIREMLKEHVRPWLAIICDYIRKGQEQGRVHPHLDPEVYLLHMINMILSSLATFECMGALIATRDDEVDLFTRHVRELLRIARASMFITNKNEPGNIERSVQGSGR
jgi:TetR/AcrR family transcriptional regulator